MKIIIEFGETSEESITFETDKDFDKRIPECIQRMIVSAVSECLSEGVLATREMLTSKHEPAIISLLGAIKKSGENLRKAREEVCIPDYERMC